MDLSLYRTLAVGRGLVYQYYYSPAAAGKQTIFFLHGFPSTSRDWRHQVSYLQPQGYGILVPDMLGAGGTARPLNLEDWKINSIATDLVDILNAHDIKQVVGVGHDWGSIALSRLSLLYPERFLAFGWIGLPFMEPITEPFDLDVVMQATRQLLGFEGYSYWKFFIRDDAAEIIESKVDSFIQLLYPKDPSCWNTYIVLPGKTQEWMDLEMKPGYPDYLDSEDIETIRQNLTENGGVKSSLNWYLSQFHNNDLEDNRAIPKQRWTLQHPSFQVVPLNDSVCPEGLSVGNMSKYGIDVTTIRCQAGHWVHLEAADEVNRALGKWLVSLK